MPKAADSADRKKTLTTPGRDIAPAVDRVAALDDGPRAAGVER